jgi:hypothetical protein
MKMMKMILLARLLRNVVSALIPKRNKFSQIVNLRKGFRKFTSFLMTLMTAIQLFKLTDRMKMTLMNKMAKKASSKEMTVFKTKKIMISILMMLWVLHPKSMSHQLTTDLI